MASRYCSQCGATINAGAKFCSSCGTSVDTWASQSSEPERESIKSSDQMKKGRPGRNILKWIGFGCGGFVVLIILLIIISIVAGTGSNSSTSSGGNSNSTPPLTYAEMVSQAIDVTYDELFRNNANYVGEIVHLRGEVVQVSEVRNERYMLRVNVTRGDYSWTDTMYVHYSGPRVLEDDLIEMVGVVNGLKTYEAIMGNSVTIPEMTASYIDVISKAGER